MERRESPVARKEFFVILKVTVDQSGFYMMQDYLRSVCNRVTAGGFQAMGISYMEALVRGKSDFGFEARGSYDHDQFLPIVRIIRTEGFMYPDAKGRVSKEGFHVTLEVAEAVRLYLENGRVEVPSNSRLHISQALGGLAVVLCEAFENPD